MGKPSQKEKRPFLKIQTERKEEEEEEQEQQVWK